jgi:hypothetical protein
MGTLSAFSSVFSTRSLIEALSNQALSFSYDRPIAYETKVQ